MEFKLSTEPVDYEEALSFMDARVEAIHKGDAPECVWLLEHPALYTAGTSAKETDLIDPRFPVFKTGRGGEYTYHGPGQRVAYVMVNLKERGKKEEGRGKSMGPDVRQYVWSLEEWIIQSLAAFGIAGERIDGRVGIWVETPSPGSGLAPFAFPLPEGRGEYKKIAAIGVRIRRWVTLHGISLNVYPDLAHFGGIVPCGISDAGVTSLRELGVDVSMEEVDAVLRDTFQKIF